MTAPTLHDDRVEKMRMSVMHRVDQDVTRRGRRVRTTIGLAAASVVVIGFGGYGLGSLSSGSNESAGASYVSDGGGSGSRAEPPAVQAPEAADESGSLANGKTLPSATDAPDADREVVTTGSVSVTVSRPRTTAQQLSAWVESIGGRVDDRSESGTGRDATASVTVRVPSSKVTATVERLGTYGTVDDVSLENTDVTSQARDLDARIDALEVSIGRLTDILAATTSSRAVIEAESALTQRQEQLESLQAERTALTDRVSLSTLTVSLTQTPTTESVDPGGFTGGLRDGWNALVATLNRVVEGIGVLLPWAAVVGVVIVAVRLAARRRRS